MNLPIRDADWEDWPDELKVDLREMVARAVRGTIVLRNDGLGEARYRVTGHSPIENDPEGKWEVGLKLIEAS